MMDDKDLDAHAQLGYYVVSVNKSFFGLFLAELVTLVAILIFILRF